LNGPSKATCPPFPERDPELCFEEVSGANGKRNKSKAAVPMKQVAKAKGVISELAKPSLS
jgi:hypothetical protein